MGPRILIVDDEPQILRGLRINLQARKYNVETAADGREALRLAASFHPDVVILDLGLPDLDGIEVIHGLRAWTTIPIIVLSGRTDGRDKVQALDAGADDYVTKPFGVDELLARVRAVTRRAAAPQDRVVEHVGRYTIDLSAHTITATDDPADSIHLTRIEWQLLEILVRNPGKLVSQRELLRTVWGPAYTDETHYLRQYMAHLRRKLEPDPARPRHLITEPGMGYRFTP